ncbi:MAG TPA: amidohydrolase family protein [Pyrinomonadaceae bacterium]|jgi:imidazolonepropionase-like amidohydrolase
MIKLKRDRFQLVASLFLTLTAINMMITSTSSSTQKPSIKIVYAGRLIDAVTDRVRTNVSVIIENGRIREVQNGKAAIPDAEIIDLSDSTVMPGLIDCHTHLTFQLEKGGTLKDLLLKRKVDFAIAATVHARRTLLAGFTTVRDVGAPDFIDVSLRDAIRAGTVPGPRMFVATYLLTITGGHGDFSSGLREELMPEPDFRRGIVNSPEDGVRAVRYMIKYGADHIKIVPTGGVLSLGDTQAGEQLTSAEMKAMIETAHMLGRKVEAHAHGVAGIKAALRAGVDSIEHGTYLDDEAIALFKQHGAYLVATISAGKWTEAKAREGWYPPVIAAKAEGLGTLIQTAFARAYRQQVKIAFGTDAGVYPHGQNALEFQYMVEAGMSPMQAILAATRNAADLLGQSNHIGTIQPGRYADLVAVQGDPLTNIKLLQNISFVMKEGQIYKRDGTPTLQ